MDVKHIHIANNLSITSIHYLPLFLFKGSWEPEHIPAVIKRRVEYTLNRSPAYHGADVLKRKQTFTHSQPKDTESDQST